MHFALLILLLIWFCRPYGAVRLRHWVVIWVCVCVNRTQVSTSHASANISSPPVIAGLMWADGWMIAAPWRRMSGFDTCHITLTHAQISDQWAEITGWNLKVLCPLHSLTQTKFCGEFSMSGRSVLSLWVSFFILSRNFFLVFLTLFMPLFLLTFQYFFGVEFLALPLSILNLHMKIYYKMNSNMIKAIMIYINWYKYEPLQYLLLYQFSLCSFHHSFFFRSWWIWVH